MACKDVGSYNSTLTTSTKLKKTEKAATLPRCIREVRSQGKPPLTKLERPTDTGQQNPINRNLLGNQCQGRET